MTDREMLALMYGALKLMPNASKEIIRLLEKQLGLEIT